VKHGDNQIFMNSERGKFVIIIFFFTSPCMMRHFEHFSENSADKSFLCVQSTPHPDNPELQVQKRVSVNTTTNESMKRELA
jgi:hypothetical protein